MKYRHCLYLDYIKYQKCNFLSVFYKLGLCCEDNKQVDVLFSLTGRLNTILASLSLCANI